ncbi:MAG TPA: caspase family protein [Longimicrobium sp.]|nr:caspase family protein [Longimicrobium sp.]
MSPFPTRPRGAAARALLCLLALLAAAPLAAQGEKRVALLIGNSAYRNASTLRNPVNDARDMGAALEALGFTVLVRTDRTQNQVKQDIREFGRMLDANTVGLFFYSGHGIQVKGENYVVPIDAEIGNEEEVEYEAVPVGLVLAQMEAARSRVNLLFLDACRNNPFARTRSAGSQGLAMMNAPTGTFIAYATAPGDLASDGNFVARNGLYTSELLRHMRTPGVVVEQMHKQVRRSVSARSNGDQVPWESSSIMGDFYFNTSGAPAQPASPRAEPEPSTEEAAATPLRAGVRASGTLTASDMKFTDNSYFDLYSYEARAGERITVTMRSGAFDTFIKVGRFAGMDFQEIASDDDGGGGTDSRVEVTLDRGGKIFIVANALNEGDTGAYTVEVAAAGGGGGGGGGGAGASALAIGQTRSGTLSRSDAMLADSSFYDTYTYQGRAGERVRISMTSSAFDTYLALGRIVNGNFQEVEADDDGGTGTNSLIVATLPANGTYLIRANSLGAGQTGAYSLSLARGAAGPPPQRAGPITAGQAVTGELSPADPVLAEDDSYYEDWTYQGRAGEVLTISMASDEFDTYLVVGTLRNGELERIASNDDSGEGTNSEVTVTLPASGTYTIRANGIGPTDLGRYTLRVSRAPR